MQRNDRKWDLATNVTTNACISVYCNCIHCRRQNVIAT